ncbi:DUF6248 family natural product biosynthesis protein [Couchioplanes azureus]|uniref:DUF6248 family natural product biosynthesis protein n=1 Tax=Couchioplanes caeruleus TaxID=56438 RepID=UPI003570A6F5
MTPSTASRTPDDHTAQWIAEHVLTRTYLKSCGGIDLVRLCSCQYGRCGHCGMGNHGKCPTRVGVAGRPPADAHTHVVGRRGWAYQPVWTTGTPCRWRCACTECATPRPTPAPPFPYRRARGDLVPGDTVWLTPKTLASPAICWQQPLRASSGSSATASTSP